MEYWIAGRPATFATKGEKLWKDKIAEIIGNGFKQIDSVEMEFYFSNENFTKDAFDIDNLCEPVFQVLTSRLGFFRGRQKNILSWRAKKSIGDNEGMLIREPKSTKFIQKSKPIFEAVYQGKFPNRATDPMILEWLEKNGYNKLNGEKFIIQLLFGTQKLSIASIADGKVKHIIDCLYPLIGGKKGAPEDHRIVELYVAKSALGLNNDQVQITIWGF